MIKTRLALAALLSTVAYTNAIADVSKPPALTATGMPALPDALAEASRPYLEFRTAGFAGWNASDRSMLISTRFGNVSQLHKVAMPMGARQQLTFEEEPVGGSIDPTGKLIVISKDAGGSEFNQLYRWDNGRLALLTDGESRNGSGPWMEDGSKMAFTSTRRNGRDNDIYIMDPRDASTAQMVMEADGGGWFPIDFLPDGKSLIVLNYISVQNMDLYLLDLETGERRPIGNPEDEIAFSSFGVAPDGQLWVTSDAGSDFKRLGTIDLDSGTFTQVGDFGAWDVDSFDISKDGGTIAVTTNEKGSDRLFLYDVASGKTRPVDTLGAGLIGGLEFAPWGEIGFSFTAAKSPTDAYSLDPTTMQVTRWTKSETGGLDPDANVEPMLIEIPSFDGERISGFLYMPDPAKFPGPRPLIVNIHGGPEGQASAGFMGSWNYYLNELGIGVFLPNVRGSTGFGKRFVSLDNGPFQRENSVKDIGAFLDFLSAFPGIDGRMGPIDKDRIGVTGGSYGGYMCYATAIHYADRVNGAVCNVAISNFVTFLENTQDYRRDLRRVEYGDERDPEQRAKLMEISPLTRISEITAPLFVIQGANDPRVPKSEADQVVAKVRQNGQPVWYLVGENEGHGFAKKENRDYQFWATLLFWDQVMNKEAE